MVLNTFSISTLAIFPQQNSLLVPQYLFQYHTRIQFLCVLFTTSTIPPTSPFPILHLLYLISFFYPPPLSLQHSCSPVSIQLNSESWQNLFHSGAVPLGSLWHCWKASPFWSFTTHTNSSFHITLSLDTHCLDRQAGRHTHECTQTHTHTENMKNNPVTLKFSPSNGQYFKALGLSAFNNIARSDDLRDITVQCIINQECCQ